MSSTHACRDRQQQRRDAASGRSRHAVQAVETGNAQASRLLLHAIARVGGAEPPSQLGAHLLGDAHRIDAVADDLRPDEDDQLGALLGLVVVAEQLAELAELVDDRQAGAAACPTAR